MIKKILQLIYKILQWISGNKNFNMANSDKTSPGAAETIRQTKQVVTGRPFWADKSTNGRGHWQEKNDSDMEREFQVSQGERSPFFWAGYAQDSSKRPFEYGPRQRERYEKFCLGFLYFYDKYVYAYAGRSHDLEGHSIYFNWKDKGGTTLDSNNGAKASRLLIFINPKPNKLIEEKFITFSLRPPAVEESDPPKPPPPPPPEMGFEEPVI